VVPLVRGGEHSAANVVGSCGSCNRRKRSKDPISWANELGRLF
jgi:5-methylcytosine-specific restriction endonuclease McrA